VFNNDIQVLPSMSQKRTVFLCVCNNVLEMVPSVSQKRTRFLCVSHKVVPFASQKRTEFLCMSNNVVEMVPSVSQKRTEFYVCITMSLRWCLLSVVFKCVEQRFCIGAFCLMSREQSFYVCLCHTRKQGFYVCLTMF